MAEFICSNQELELEKKNLLSTIMTLKGQTLTHRNGFKHTILNVFENGNIETTTGKIFSILGLKSFNLSDEFIKQYNTYFDKEKRIDDIEKSINNYHYKLVGASNYYREKFYDELIGNLPYENIISANKRASDPQYLKLNISDEFYLENNLNKNSFELGINTSYSLLSTFVIVDGIENREEFMKRARKIIKSSGSNYIVKEASVGDKDSRSIGVRIHNNAKLYVDNFETSIEYLKELIKDTLYIIKNVGMFN